MLNSHHIYHLFRLLFISSPFFLDNFTIFLKEIKFNEFFEKFISLKERAELKWWRIANIIKIVLLILYSPLIVLLPLWALWVTLPLISSYFVLILVLVLQFMVILIFASYFSYLLVKKN